MLEGLPIQVARSVASALSEYTGLPVGISLPNDLTICGKKVSGTLCTSRIVGESVEWVLCGIGINTNMGCSELPLPGITSLAIESGGEHFEHGQLLEAVLERLRWIREGDYAGCAGYADKPILSSKVQ
jgi:biotin-(acetyl-CoA carboxylase) ligase